MVKEYAQISRVANSYWQELWSTRSGNSIWEKTHRCSLEKEGIRLVPDSNFRKQMLFFTSFCDNNMSNIYHSIFCFTTLLTFVKYLFFILSDIIYRSNLFWLCPWWYDCNELYIHVHCIVILWRHNMAHSPNVFIVVWRTFLLLGFT